EEPMSTIHRGASRFRTAVAVLGVALAGTGVAATGDQKCEASKIKAAAKEGDAKAKCYQKAVLARTDVDPACLVQAENKLSAAVTKADLLGSCPGSASDLGAVVNDFIDALATTAGSTTTTTVSGSTTTTTVPSGQCCFSNSNTCTEIT